MRWIDLKNCPYCGASEVFLSAPKTSARINTVNNGSRDACRRLLCVSYACRVGSL
jgi:hypothetical protein